MEQRALSIEIRMLDVLLTIVLNLPRARINVNKLLLCSMEVTVIIMPLNEAYKPSDFLTDLI